MNILLVCSAGMSTSLLVTRMLEAAKKQGLELKIEAHPVAEVEAYGEDADAILLGPQVRFQFKNIQSLYPDKVVEVIDMRDYGMMNGEKVLKHVLAALEKIERMIVMKSQELRELAPELDPLRIGTGWKVEDLDKMQIFIESTYGDSHPGSAHLNELVGYVEESLQKVNAKGAKYYATDMCDGEAQGHDGINYSLCSREMMTNMIEIQYEATPFDGCVFLSSCDKAVPAHLKAIARLNAPSIIIPGGVMNAGPDLLTLEQIGKYSAQYQRGEITLDEFNYYKHNACPSCGACSFIGTATTMQIMSEALGLALPGTSLLPATSQELKDVAKNIGGHIRFLVERNIKPSDILTKEAFENAIMVHAAIAGSTNALLHLPAIAHEAGIELTGEDFDRIHRTIPYILNLRPSGFYPAQYYYYAGGTPAIMEAIKDHLHLDVMTVTGKKL